MCRNEREPELTELFKSYVELMRFVRRENNSFFWTETNLAFLRQMIIKFKPLGKSVFRAYQLSSMGTQRWNLLNYLVDSIRHVDCIQFLHGRLYEGSQKIFKTVYGKKLKATRIRNG